MKKFLLFIFSVIISSATVFTDDYSDFGLINPQETRNIYGNYAVIGNTVEGVTLCKSLESNESITICPIKKDDNFHFYNNKYIARYLITSDIDDENISLEYGSVAYLKLPADAKKIVWAALFWQGHINNYSYLSSNYTSNISLDDGYDKYYTNQSDDHKYIYDYYSDINQTYYNLSNDLPENNIDKIKDMYANLVGLKIGNYNFRIVEADELFYKGDSRYFCKLTSGCEDFKGDEENHLDDFEKRNGVKYGAYVVLDSNYLDMLNSQLSIIKSSGLPIQISNLVTSQGLDSKLGNYGAWSLVVIYTEDTQDPNAKLRSINIYKGFKNLYSSIPNLSITVDHLVLPHNGAVESQMTVFSAEGEKSNIGDYVDINDINLTENAPGFDPNNEFDSVLSDDILRIPMLENNNGIDIDNFDASVAMTKIRDANPDASEYSATLNVHTTVDGIFLGMIAFATELYQPRICYYIDTIRDGDKIIYQNGQFIDNAQIDPSKEYNITIWYSNMKKDPLDEDIADAKDVKIFMSTHYFEYVQNTTSMKNIGWNDFIHQSDEPNDDLFTFYADTNLSKYNIGDGADENNGGLLRVASNFDDNNAKVYVNFLGKFNVDENATQIDLDGVFNFKASFETDWVKIEDDNAQEIVKCVPFNTVANVYTPPFGTFNAVEPNNLQTILNQNSDPADENDPLNNLYTKIVNKPFTVDIIHISDDNTTLSDYHGFIMVSVVDANVTNEDELNHKQSISPTFVVFNGKSVELSFNVPQAIKNARFRITYIKGDRDGLAFRWTTMNECQAQIEGSGDITMSCIWEMMAAKYGQEAENCMRTASEDIPDCFCARECSYYNKATGYGGNNPAKQNQRCLECLFGHFGEHAYSRDNFSVRPKNFQITAPSGKLKAGENYTFTIKALDNNGVPSIDYNETLNLSNVSPMLDYNDTNASNGCNRGVITFITNPVKFINGTANVVLKYSEVGDLNISVKEVNGSEFANVDSNDNLNPEGNLISTATIIKTFIPYNFAISTISYNNGGNGFTYISRDLNMSSVLSFSLIAKNKDGQTTQNYKKACYADNVEVNVSHSTVTNNFNLLYKEENETVVHDTLNTLPISFTVIKNKFSNGLAQINTKINFKKDYSSPVNPFVFNLTSINALDSDAVNGNVLVNLNANFIYGRIVIPDISSYSGVIHNSVKYEYYKNGNWEVNNFHNSSLEGDINITNSVVPNVSLSLSPISSGYEDLKYTTSKPLPYSVRGEYDISSWMWYHPKATTYQAPSSTNHNCLTHPCNKINFLIVASGWAGIGDNNSTYAPENNRTIKAQSSADVNASKSQVKAINW
ncbi:hypothetical protein [Caminibacter pacificus]|uniref:Uncharacterized protein n=1 Tax=Caminibacter pacificus TaxID=1424653 RepID=A0AAJ4UXX1_9BACT|nr:hypothetical protein [Caminibacter pacificus]QCI27856.1 hypothetical protein C6V80_02410 [Caminibacter pacificus]ROR39966.1 hypothetical protein EDC58_0946 [Caminibacter pacificus]